MITIYENKFGNAAIDTSAENLIIQLSGGFDSAVLLYMMAKTLTDVTANGTIWPITVRKVGNKFNDPNLDKSNPYPTVEKIIDYVSKIFPLVNIKPTQTWDLHGCWDENAGKMYVGAQDDAVFKIYSIIEDISPNSKPITYSGVTKNPNIVIGEEFFDVTDDLGNITSVKRNPEHHRDFVVPSAIKNTATVVSNGKGRVHYAPFRNADKRVTIQFAAQFGILEDLLKIARSCEGRRVQTDNFTTTCIGPYKCWWCYEREWALENYLKVQ